LRNWDTSEDIIIFTGKMSQQGGRKRYANEIIENDSIAKKPRKGESDAVGSQNRENQGGDTSLPSSQPGPVTRSQTASQETPTDLTGGQPQDPASTGTERVVHVPTPTRITRSTATACDICYDSHRKVLPSRDVANEKSVRRLMGAPEVKKIPAEIAP
jgi:hypothetical protein